METPSCYRDPLLYLLSSALLFLFVLPAPAQFDDIRFQHFEPEEGLSRFMFYDIYQDTFGFMWFENFRYDGREMKSYPNGSVAGVRVGELLSDNWGGAPDSLYYYDPVRDAFIDNYAAYIKQLVIKQNDIEWALKDCSYCRVKPDAQNIWFGTPSEGLFIYHQPTKSFNNIRHRMEDSTSLSSNKISTILKDQKEQIWMGTQDAGLNLWMKDASFWRFRHEPGNLNSLSSDSIITMQEDPRGFIWIGTPRGLNRLNGTTKEITRIPYPGSAPLSVGKIFIDSSGKLWIGTADGRMLTFDPAEEVFQKYLTDNNGQSIFPYMNDLLFSVVEDNRQRIWIGTEHSGLYIHDPETKTTSNYQFDPLDPKSLSDRSIRKIYKDNNGRMWIGTFTQVNWYDPNEKLFVHLESNKKATQFFNSHPKYNGLEDREGNIWVASSGVGLIKFDPQTGDISVYKKGQPPSTSFLTNLLIKIAEDDLGNIWITESAVSKDSSTTSIEGVLHILDPSADKFTIKYRTSFINALYKGSEGRIWVGGIDGLISFSNAHSKPTIHRWETFKGASENLPANLNVILEGCAGEFWISTQGGGLLKIDWEENSVRQFLPDPEIPSSIAGRIVWHMTFDRDCNLWMALPGKGLSMLPYDQQNVPDPAFQLWNTKNSNLPDNNVTDVLQDHQGRISVASHRGVSCYDQATNSFNTYGAEVGMKTIPISMTLSKDGRIYIGGLNGIGYFHPDSLAVNQHIPPVYLKDIQINGQSLPLQGTPGDTLSFPSPLQHSITFTKEIRLKYNQNDIRLEFVALNYTAPKRNQFKYQLIGYDEEWQSTNAINPYATYTNLDPGTYTFRVIGANNDGYRNEEGATLEIIISPPWWRTGWAYLLYAVLIVAGVLSIYRFQLNRQLAAAETRRLRELDEVKTRLYTNITHEFRTPLTVILGIADQMERNPKEWFREGLRMIRRNGQNLLTLVQQMLDLRRLESGTLPVNLIQGDVVNYLQYLTESFHAYAESKDIRLHFLCPYEELYLDYDPEKLLTIVSNLLSNAVKYTPEGGDVYVATSAERTSSALRTLQIEVQDTGPGIPEQKLPQIFDRFYQADDSATRRGEGTGIGLALTKELVQLLGGSIQVASTQGKGTTFTIQLPVTRDAEKESQHEEKPARENTGAFVPPAPNQEIFEATTNTAEDQPLALLVEDNEDVIRYLSTCLESDYRLATARNGREGIEKALELVPDVIISDVMMPEKDGYEVTAILKQDFRTSHIPIILLTAKADADSRLEGLEQGADAYLTKPFQPEELEVRLRKLVELRRKLQQRYVDAARLARFSKSGKSPDSEDAFLQQFRRLIEEHMSDEHFGTPQLLKALGMSRTQLHNKLKALTGKPTSHVIRSIRLQRAKELLENTELNVSEVAFEVGFNSLTYFSSSFSEEFGVPPSEVRS